MTLPFVPVSDGPTRHNFEVAAGKVGPLTEIVFYGTGSPEGVVTATRALYIDLEGGSGSTLWVKETGAATNTGWVPK